MQPPKPRPKSATSSFHDSETIHHAIAELDQVLQQQDLIGQSDDSNLDSTVKPSPKQSNSSRSTKRGGGGSQHNILSRLENRLFITDQITRKLHAHNKQLSQENQTLHNRIDELNRVLSSEIRVSELLRRLDEQEVMIQELTAYCESLEEKCKSLESNKSSQSQEKKQLKMKMAEQKIKLLETKYITVQQAYQQLLNVKVDKFMSNFSSKSSKKGIEASTQQLIIALRTRLNQLIQDQTVEQNMNNSMLYELEAQNAKFFATIEVLNQRIEQLKREKKNDPLSYVT